jgi:osmoprotectant transport system permease protein
MRRIFPPAADPVRLLLLVLACPAALLPFLSHARNRLISGMPVPLSAVLAQAGPLASGAFLAACALLAALPFLPPRKASHVAAALVAGLLAGAVIWLAGEAAVSLAANAPAAARTSLGGGGWVLLGGVALLLLSDAAARLPAGLALPAIVASLVPTIVVLEAGGASQMALAREFANQQDVFNQALLRHGEIVLAALVPTLLIGVPLGIAAHRRKRLAGVLFPVLNIIQTIPSIALFGLLMVPLSGLAASIPLLAQLGISGVGLAPAAIALALYSLLPIVRNTVEGLAGVPAGVAEAARGMGMTRRQAFWRVDVPLALPVFLSGLRITVVQAVGLAAVAALIGAGGLGAIMFRGLFANALDLVLLGALPVILLAVLADAALRGLAGWSRWRNA